MNIDGTLSKKGGRGKKKADDEIWYGRTVIRSCARLDYATAQNIIDGKVATGESKVDESYWPKSRQPTCGHTIDQVAADVRLMHKVAMARRKLRFGNGALALNGIKLAFQLEDDGETPKICAPYPIRDSNRLIEEYMLLANYFVAQRLITHAHGRALIRNHSPPIEQGMQTVVDVSKEAHNFDIDTTNSSTLQASLSRLSRECDDELVVQCVTESLMTPMKPAEYIAAGELDEMDWHHFALNIPYYTHFTSPIRRYPDVIVSYSFVLIPITHAIVLVCPHTLTIFASSNERFIACYRQHLTIMLTNSLRINLRFIVQRATVMINECLQRQRKTEVIASFCHSTLRRIQLLQPWEFA